MEKHRGGLVLGLAIAGFICFPTAIVALIFANGDLKKMAAGQMDPEGQGMTKAGKIVSIIMIVLAVIGIILQLTVLPALLKNLDAEMETAPIEQVQP